MPYIPATGKADLKTRLLAVEGVQDNVSLDEFAGAIADWMSYVIGQLQVNPGIPVTVVVPAGTGSTVGPGTVS